MSSPTDSSQRSIPFFSPSQHSKPLPPPSPAPPPTTPCIFAAFDTDSWPEVRRAVAADPSCLSSLHPILHLPPLEYAFSLISNTSAILAHCDRAGIPSPAHAPRSPRQALVASAKITHLFLTSFAPHLPPPVTPVLHVALNTHLPLLAHALLAAWPFLASRPAGGQPPLHALAASMTAASAPTSWGATGLGLARALLARGADAAATDAHGRGALYELCSAASAAQPFGLVRRGRRHPFGGVEAFVRLLIINGARPCAVDKNGVSAIRVAVARAVDYHFILRVADEVYRKLADTPRLECREGGAEVAVFGEGKITQLPEDVLRKIVARCSPRDAVAGIGATSTYFRSVATSDEHWRASLSYPYTLDHARKCVRQLDSQSK